MPDKGRWDYDALPPLDDPFLAECLLSCGPVEATGMGISGISPQRLESWMRLTGYELNEWQAETLLAASAGYANVAANDKAPMPWNEIEDIVATNSIKAALRNAAK